MHLVGVHLIGLVNGETTDNYGDLSLAPVGTKSLGDNLTVGYL